MRNMKKILMFPAKNISYGEACQIVKYSLGDGAVDYLSKTLAIKMVSEMETHNSVTKNELVNALRWIFEHYDFGID